MPSGNFLFNKDPSSSFVIFPFVLSHNSSTNIKFIISVYVFYKIRLLINSMQDGCTTSPFTFPHTDGSHVLLPGRNFTPKGKKTLCMKHISKTRTESVSNNSCSVSYRHEVWKSRVPKCNGCNEQLEPSLIHTVDRPTDRPASQHNFSSLFFSVQTFIPFIRVVLCV